MTNDRDTYPERWASGQAIKGGWRQSPPAQSSAGWRLPGWVFLAVPALVELVIGGYRPDNLGKLAAIVAASERPGDAVLFVPSKLRATTYANPAVWARLRDVELARPPAASASLAGTQVSPAVLAQRFSGIDRAWLVTSRRAVRGKMLLSQMSQAALSLTRTMHLIRQWQVHSTVLRLYSRTA